MKIVKRWFDERYRAENIVYQLPKGTLFLHSKDPKTIDSVFAITSLIGSFFNDIIEVKGGTAHFLEHILGGRPNKTFKTKNQIDNYEFGTKKYPKIHSNAWTSRAGVIFYGTSHHKGETRLLKRIISMMEFDPEKMNKYIEKERKIILSELGEKSKPQKNSVLQFWKFAFKDLGPEYQRYVLGTEEDIKGIATNDLQKFYKVIFNRDAVILSLQSNLDISEETETLLNYADEIVFQNKNKIDKKPEEKIENQFRYKHFFHERATNIYVELSCFEKDLLKIDYNQRVTRILSYNLVNYLIFEIIREKKGYVYSSEAIYNSSLLAKYNSKGICFSTNKQNFVKALNEYFKIISKGAENFLKTASGKNWLESQISGTIFPNTMEYDDDYGRSKASHYLEGYDIYDYSKLKKAVLKVKSNDLTNYIKKVFLDTPHLVWIQSDLNEKTIYKDFKKTDYYKYQSKLPISQP